MEKEKSKMGRPKVKDPRIGFTVRITREERDLMKKKAKKEGMTLYHWARTTLVRKNDNEIC